MPTPNIATTTSLHSSCPPDDDRASWRTTDDSQEGVDVPAPEVSQQPTPPPSDSQPAGSADTHITRQRESKRTDIEEEINAPDMLSPISTEGEKHEDNELRTLTRTDLGSPSMGYDFSNIRVRYLPTLLSPYQD